MIGSDFELNCVFEHRLKIVGRGVCGSQRSCPNLYFSVLQMHISSFETQATLFRDL